MIANAQARVLQLAIATTTAVAKHMFFAIMTSPLRQLDGA